MPFLAGLMGIGGGAAAGGTAAGGAAAGTAAGVSTPLMLSMAGKAGSVPAMSIAGQASALPGLSVASQAAAPTMGSKILAAMKELPDNPQVKAVGKMAEGMMKNASSGPMATGSANRNFSQMQNPDEQIASILMRIFGDM